MVIQRNILTTINIIALNNNLHSGSFFGSFSMSSVEVDPQPPSASVISTSSNLNKYICLNVGHYLMQLYYSVVVRTNPE